MEYIKIIANSNSEALFEARRQHGPNIIPMNFKEIKVGGLLGTKILSKTKTELTIALRDETKERASFINKVNKSKSDALINKPTLDIDWSESKEKTKSVNSEIKIEQNLEKDENTIKALKSLLNKAEVSAPGSGRSDKEEKSFKMENSEIKLTHSQKSLEKNGFNGKSTENANNYSQLMKEVSDIRSMLQELRNSENKFFSADRYYDTPLDRWELRLLDADFSQEYVDHIISEVREKLSIEEVNDRDIIKQKILMTLKSRIGIATPIMKSSDKKKIIAFIGPTGVGKTTTLAKLGAIYTFYKNRSVAFITIDNYRIAATEQLKRYSSIININTHVVSNTEQLQKVLNQEESELVLIDTSGRSPYNKKHLDEIKEMFANISQPVEKVLVTSATAKRMDQQVIFERFSQVGVDKVIFSKLDESTAIGGLVEVADKYNKGISNITFGQDVPSDIEEAVAQKIALLAIGDRNKPLFPPANQE